MEISPMRILIAEDDLTSRMLLAAVLKKNGHEVIETVDGAAAWHILQSPDPPKIIILDWMMPVMDGLEVLRRIRNMETDSPPYILMLTSKDEKSDIITGLDAGADDYLTKPFHPGELRARVGVGRRLIEMQAELKNIRNALAHEATHDLLTGTFNRRAIENALSLALSRLHRSHDGLAIGICDIDHFKKVNDTFGHLVGDDVLCGFVHLLQKHLRDYDQLGRFGGEEFLLIAPGVTGDGTNLFERLRRTVEENTIITRAGNISITISIGVKTVRENESMDTVISAADTALYKAKSEGRNRVCFHNDSDV
jgi:diguanylate cyclase (GGDEF)-like protein